MIEYLVLVFAVPLGMILAVTTRHEKEIYSKPIYFPLMVWVLAFLSAIFLNIDKTIGMSMLFTFITTFVWWKA